MPKCLYFLTRSSHIWYNCHILQFKLQLECDMCWYRYKSQSENHCTECDKSYSPTLCSGFHYETYIGISPHRTLAVAWTAIYGSYVIYGTWSCEKIQTLFIFRAIWENTAHVQWIRCSRKGSHRIHWTSAVFFHIALKWTPFAYLIALCAVVSL